MNQRSSVRGSVKPNLRFAFPLPFRSGGISPMAVDVHDVNCHRLQSGQVSHEAVDRISEDFRGVSTHGCRASRFVIAGRECQVKETLRAVSPDSRSGMARRQEALGHRAEGRPPHHSMTMDTGGGDYKRRGRPEA